MTLKRTEPKPKKKKVTEPEKRITLRYPVELHEKISVVAKEERRTVTKQIIKILEDAVKGR